MFLGLDIPNQQFILVDEGHEVDSDLASGLFGLAFSVLATVRRLPPCGMIRHTSCINIC